MCVLLLVPERFNSLMNLQAIIVLTLVASMLISTVLMVFNTGTPDGAKHHPTPVSTITPETSGGASLSPVTDSEESGYERLTLINRGNLAPDFKTIDAKGKMVGLSNLIGTHGLVVVFYQGVFCSVCANQLAGIQASLAAFKARKVHVLAVSADDKPDALKRMGESGLTFPVIPDPQRKLINAFGVTNHARGNIAYPTVYFIDKQGKVADTFADPQMARLQAPEIIKKIDALTL
jgi:peroxiredoxin